MNIFPQKKTAEPDEKNTPAISIRENTVDHDSGQSARRRWPATTWALATLLWFLAVGAAAETTNTLSDAEIQGRQLAQQLGEARPAESLTNTAVLKIRDAKKNWREIPVRFQVVVAGAEAPGWEARYETMDTNAVRLTISHAANRPNRYHLNTNGQPADLSGGEMDIPFAGSDFSMGDFGLEFLFWPDQKILKKEFHNNCASMVLESRNPRPPEHGCARVVARIEEENGGIMEAQTYDASGRQIKDFSVKNLKKINGRWQVEVVIMKNFQAGTLTRLEFDLNR
jgi:hypothetical protein